jgi:hypothetical protein
MGLVEDTSRDLEKVGHCATPQIAFGATEPSQHGSVELDHLADRRQRPKWPTCHSRTSDHCPNLSAPNTVIAAI